MKPLLIDFFDKRQETLSRFKENKLNLNSIRQLYILFTVDIHHVNCFNRHIRFYGYMMKKPASINGDEITNGVRLARGIIMRALELIRHVPQYNIHRDYLLRFLIAALKQRASLSKSLLTVIGENDYTELYEVASYLDHTRKMGFTLMRLIRIYSYKKLASMHIISWTRLHFRQHLAGLITLNLFNV